MSDNVIHVSDQDFESEVLASDRPVLVDFWAEWCVPCHMVSPVVEEIARDHAGELKAAKLNVDDNPETTRKYGVRMAVVLSTNAPGTYRVDWLAVSLDDGHTTQGSFQFSVVAGGASRVAAQANAQ